jgi:hypothetical protein
MSVVLRPWVAANPTLKAYVAIILYTVSLTLGAAYYAWITIVRNASRQLCKLLIIARDY